MPDEITVEELFDSREVTTGVNPSAELRYVVRGTIDEVAARAAIVDQTPAYYDLYGTGLLFLPRINISFEKPVNNSTLKATVHYGPVPQTNTSVFSFNTSGGTRHITHSMETIGRYGINANGQQITAPDCKRAIGVTLDNVEGVSVTVPVYQWGETHYLPASVVTEAYKDRLFRLTGTVNDVPFRNFAAGEVLFLGASGQKRGFGDWELHFSFASSRNFTDLRIGDITGINKRGWDYLWVRFADTVDDASKTLVKIPVGVYVERVYEYSNFDLLNIRRFNPGEFAHSGQSQSFPGG